ncbi:two-component system response regulator CreB [Congregicoccus parvus]|uniref:two-component system response regulator CreB n=1 Tax=Congregicoccus parvus TaxID=3081749 RepID=UPI003FA57FFA
MASPAHTAPSVAPRPAVLIVEDEPAIADTIVYALRTEGFEPVPHATIGGARAALAARAFALVVLDIGLPDGSGFDFCRELHAAGARIPIIFLTSRSAEIDRVVGLEIGADDYVVKPFSPRELTARIRAVLRRANTGGNSTSTAVTSTPASTDPMPPPAATLRRLGPFAIDEERLEVAYIDQRLDLTRREYRLLLALLTRPERVFSRDQLLQHAWDEPEASLDRTVDAHVKTLRAKLRAVDPARDPIRTHRGFGYSISFAAS